MRITVLNKSTRISDGDAIKMSLAVGLQLSAHVALTWDRVAPAVLFQPGSPILGDDEQIVLFDAPDQADALGYHAEGPDGKPYGKVFVGPVLDAGGGVLDGGTSGTSVASELSHEAIELVGDPDVNLWADGPTRAEGSSYAVELCDPCEATSYTITLEDGTRVLVSDFVTPAWFDEEAPSGSVFDWCQVVKAPFALGPGGYCVVRAAPGSEQQVFAETAPARWRSAGRLHPAARAFKRCARKARRGPDDGHDPPIGDEGR